MRLLVINCARYSPGQACAIINAMPSDRVCGACEKRTPNRRPFEMLMHIVDDAAPEPPPLDDEQRFIWLCEWRVRDNYNETGRAILYAGKVEEFDGKWRITRAAYKAAQKHRA